MGKENFVVYGILLVTLYCTGTHSNDQVEITTPSNSVFYRKMGNLYPSVNVGHIRLQINLTKVRGITTTICSHADNLAP